MLVFDKTDSIEGMAPKSAPSQPFHMNTRSRGGPAAEVSVSPTKNTQPIPQPSPTRPSPSTKHRRGDAVDVAPDSPSTAPTSRKSTRQRAKTLKATSAALVKKEPAMKQPSLPTPRDTKTQRRKTGAKSSSEASNVDLTSQSQPAAPSPASNSQQSTSSKGKERETVDESDHAPQTNINTRSKTRAAPDVAQSLSTKQRKAIEKNPALKTKFERMGVLKGKFAGITRGIKPALKELARRSERQRLEDEEDEATQQTLQQIATELRPTIDAYRDSLRHENTAQEDQLTHDHNETDEAGPSMGQGSNERHARNPSGEGSSTGSRRKARGGKPSTTSASANRRWDREYGTVDSPPADADGDETDGARSQSEEAQAIGEFLRNQTDDTIRKVIGQEAGPKRVKFALESGTGAKGIKQTKKSKQGPDFKPHGFDAARYREKRLGRIRKESAKKEAAAAAADEKKKERARKGKGKARR